MPSLPDDPQQLRRLAMDHLDRVREDPQATWQDHKQALEWALLACCQPPASTPSQHSTALSAPRTTMPELPNPKAASTEPTATCQGCGLPIYRPAAGTWNLVYREWDNTRICWPNNAGDHQPAATDLPGGPSA